MKTGPSLEVLGWKVKPTPPILGHDDDHAPLLDRRHPWRDRREYSLLVLREIFFGVRRFDAIARNIGAPRDVLAARLRHLVEAGVLEKVPYSERPPRFDYRLTAAGRELGRCC